MFAVSLQLREKKVECLFCLIDIFFPSDQWLPGGCWLVLMRSYISNCISTWNKKKLWRIVLLFKKLIQMDLDLDTFLVLGTQLH